MAGFLAVVLLSTVAGLYALMTISSVGKLAIDMYDKPLMAINFTRSAQTRFSMSGIEGNKSIDMNLRLFVFFLIEHAQKSTHLPLISQSP